MPHEPSPVIYCRWGQASRSRDSQDLHALNCDGYSITCWLRVIAITPPWGVKQETTWSQLCGGSGTAPGTAPDPKPCSGIPSQHHPSLPAQPPTLSAQSQVLLPHHIPICSPEAHPAPRHQRTRATLPLLPSGSVISKSCYEPVPRILQYGLLLWFLFFLKEYIAHISRNPSRVK